jgi:hypothetical protein
VVHAVRSESGRAVRRYFIETQCRGHRYARLARGPGAGVYQLLDERPLAGRVDVMNACTQGRIDRGPAELDEGTDAGYENLHVRQGLGQGVHVTDGRNADLGIARLRRQPAELVAIATRDREVRAAT